MQLLFRTPRADGAPYLDGRLPFGDRAVGFAEISADAGLSPCRASIPDAEQAPPPVISVGAAMLGSSIYEE